jgi:hypothetical protein
MKIFIYKFTFPKQKFFIFIPFTYICGDILNFLMNEAHKTETCENVGLGTIMQQVDAGSKFTMISVLDVGSKC